jgi:hypothetical protein
MAFIAISLPATAFLSPSHRMLLAGVKPHHLAGENSGSREPCHAVPMSRITASAARRFLDIRGLYTCCCAERRPRDRSRHAAFR